MSGWAPMDVEWWPFVADGLAKPWPREAVWFDLRWWADRERMKRGEAPGRRQLAARWGWSERRTRDVIPDLDVWWDEAIPRTSQSDPKVVPATSQSGPATGPTNADNRADSSQKGPTDVPERSQKGPTDVPPHPENDGNTGTSEGPTSTPQTQHTTHFRVGLAEVMTMYRQWHPRVADKAAKDLGLAARVKDHGPEAVIAVIRWAHESPDGRAQYLREKKYLGPTLFRPKNFAEYLGLAEEAAPVPAAQTAAFGPPRLVLDPVAAFIADFQALEVRRDTFPITPKPTDPEVTRRIAAICSTPGGWSRWCNVTHPNERRDYLADLRNAYLRAA